MPVTIHNKQYNTVAERIEKAGKDLIEVRTKVLNNNPVVIKATIKTTKGTFTGISAANPMKQIEKENPYEVAETSSVGRALAFAGYETTNGIASAEEMFKEPIRDIVREPVKEGRDKEKCGVCGTKLIFKTGTNKDGRTWKGYFCPNRDQDPIFVK